MRNATSTWSRVRLLPLVLSILAFAGAPLFGAAPADAQIKSALDDIQRFESQTAGNPSSATINRTLKLLGLTRQRLDSSPNKSHPSWAEADAKLNALVQRLQSPAAPAASSSAPSPPAPTTTTSPPRSGSGNTPASMISQYRVRIQKLARDVASATQTLDQDGPKPFQSSEYVAQQERKAEIFRESLANYAEYAGDPDVEAARQALEKFENFVALGRELAAKVIAEIGDVQAGLAALDAQRTKVAAAPDSPFTTEQVRAWLTTLAQMRQASADALQRLAVYQDRAYLPLQDGTVGQGAAYDFQDVDRLRAAFSDNVRSIDASLQQFSANLDLNVEHVADTIGHVDQLNPEDPNDQTNGFLGAGHAAEIRARLEQARQLAAVAVAYDTLLQREEQLAPHQKMLGRVEAAQADYAAKYQRARNLVRMPKAKSTDRALVAIARETLANPAYEVGEIRRLVLNTDKVHREKKTSEQQFDKVDVSLSGTVTLSGTETTYSYAWDEFQVATAEPVGDTFYIYYNTLKYFTSGATTTPLNRWILAGRFQGSEIPEANIDQD